MLTPMTPEEKQIISYLEKNFNPFVEDLVVKIIKDKPADSYHYILDWLEKDGPQIQSKIATAN